MYDNEKLERSQRSLLLYLAHLPAVVQLVID